MSQVIKRSKNTFKKIEPIKYIFAPEKTTKQQYEYRRETKANHYQHPGEGEPDLGNCRQVGGRV